MTSKAADAVNAAMAAEAPAKRPWPVYRSALVAQTIGQLNVMKERMLEEDGATREAYATASGMLRDYLLACETAEREQELKNRAKLTMDSYQRGILDAKVQTDARMKEFQSTDAYREAERIIAARALKAKRNEKRRATRKGATRG